MPALHVRYEGRSIDLVTDDLDIGDESTDHDIRAAVATALEVPANKLAAFTVDRNPETLDITLRPQAVFGQ